MTIKTKSVFADPYEPDKDGIRMLIAHSRYQADINKLKPNFAKDDYASTSKYLAPSKELYTAYIKNIKSEIWTDEEWSEYDRKYRQEMHASEQTQRVIKEFAQKSLNGETITLLCYCKNIDKKNHCHRFIAKELIEKEKAKSKPTIEELSKESTRNYIRKNDRVTYLDE